ncbi:MAG: alpha/beta fold hydrolase [Puniceicoccaceae bacterium]
MQTEDIRVKVQVAGYAASMSQHNCGDPAAPTILALHGFSGSGKDFDPLRLALGSTVSWICPDFMGHGESEAPEVLDPYRLPAVLSLIDQARSMAHDPGNILLLGYSMGGRLALHYLRYAKAMPALLIGASPGLQDATERAQRRQSDQEWIRRLDVSVEHFCNDWEMQPLIVPQTLIEEPFRSQLASRRRGNRKVGLQNALLAGGTGVLPSLWHHLSELPSISLCHGSEDGKFRETANRMQAAHAGFTVHELPDSGHSPHLENPKAMASLISGELDSPLYR